MSKEKTSKRPLVLWSGGFDSTCLVIDKLREGEHIDIMYVNLDNNKHGQSFEKKAIKKMSALIKEANLPGKIISEFDFGYHAITPNKAVFAQPALWLQAVSFIVDPKVHSEINIAYVKADDIWHYKTELQNLYGAMLALTCHDDEIVPLKFPYEWQTKADLLDNLESFVYYKQIMKLVYYCESGTKEPCGTCTSCMRHITEVKETERVVAVEIPLKESVEVDA